MQPPPLTVTELRNPPVMEVTDLLDLHRFRIDAGPWRVRNPTGNTSATSQHMRGLIYLFAAVTDKRTTYGHTRNPLRESWGGPHLS
jgi:hypothetical protein